jgi:hypothetical protein
MPRFRVPVYFTVLASVEVEAANYQDACVTAYGTCPLPPKSDWQYLDHSFHVREGDPFEVQDQTIGEWETRETAEEPVEDDGQPAFMTEHDSAMRDCGWGTDEDYGYFDGDA